MNPKAAKQLDEASDLARTVFARISVFPATFTIQAAEATAADGTLDEALITDLMNELAELGVVHWQETAGRRRFRFEENLRTLGLEILIEKGEEESVRGRMLDWAVEFVEWAGPELFGSEQGNWFEILELEIENLEEAIEWSIEHDPNKGLAVAGMLRRFWSLRHDAPRGQEWLQRLLASEKTSSPVARSSALSSAGMLAAEHGHLGAALELHQLGLDLARHSGDERLVADLLYQLAEVTRLKNDLSSARRIHEEALVVRRRMNDADALAQSLRALGVLTQSQGDYFSAKSHLEEARVVLNKGGKPSELAAVLLQLSTLAVQRGDYATARDLLEQSSKLTDAS